MKHLAFISLLILTFGFTAFGQKTKKVTTVDTSVADEKAVRVVFDDLLAGIRNSNIDGVTGAYWNSPQTLYFNSNGSVTRGWEDDRKNREVRYPKTSNVKLDVRNVTVMMLGKEGAVIACQWKQTQDYEANPESASGRMSLVFKKIGKEWKIVHLHTSPDLPKADRPVMPSEKDIKNN